MNYCFSIDVMKKFWSQPLRVECPNEVQHITCRCARSALWFVNNPALEERILAFLAKYKEKYGVRIYAFQLVGNHYHMLAKFPGANTSSFFRDFNARVAESVRLLVKEFDSGQVFERRYTSQVLTDRGTIEDYFYYCALQFVSSGQCTRISEYPGYSFFHDAVNEISRTYKHFSYREYENARRKNPEVNPNEFWREYELRYDRLPGYESTDAREYQSLMRSRLEDKRMALIANSEARFRTKSELRRVRPGSIPRKTKKGTRRPLVLGTNLEARNSYLEWYFSIVRAYKRASERYRSGAYDVLFPFGTYRPSALSFAPT